jgi:predicted permease
MFRWLAACGVALRSILRRRRMDDELTEELEHHLDRQIDEGLNAGLSRRDAGHAARRALGDIEGAKEQIRDGRSGAWIDQVRRDARFSVRAMMRRPGFTCLAVLTIGLGIGATTAIFSVTDGVLFRPLPFAEADRLVAVWERRPAFNRPRLEAAPLNYVDWTRDAKSFDALTAYFFDSMSLTGSGTPERLPVAAVTPNFMSVLGVRPLAGRAFEFPDGTPGQAATTVLSYGLWQRRFGGDLTIVGRTIRLNNAPHLVIGVMPSSFQFPHPRIQAWVPVDYVRGAGIQNRTMFALRVVGRLRPGVTAEAATTELGVIADRLARESPMNRNASAFAVPLQDDLARDERTSFLLLLGAAGLVLLIACANVAGLLITRGAGREAEFVVRMALGASRGELARQLLVEGLLLSAAGAIVGVAMATRAFGLLNALVPESMQGTVTASFDRRLLVFGVIAAIVTGVVFGLIPLRHAFQRDLRTPLGTRTGPIDTAGRLRVLVALEVTLAVVVLFSTGLMLQTIVNLRAADVGFEKQNVLTARVELAPAEYPTFQHRFNFYAELLERMGGHPGVVSAGLITFLPYKEAIGAAPLRVEDRPDVTNNLSPVYLRAVTPGYLPTMKVPVVAGRGFSADDTAATERVALVEERVDAALGGSLIGRRVDWGRTNDWLRVIGIVGNIRHEGVEAADSRGALYVPAAQVQESGAVSAFFLPRDLAVRTTGDPMTLAEAVQREIWAINPNQPVADIRTLDALVDGQIADERVQTGLLTAFSGLALFMAALGIYGLLSFTVAARMREIGVRMALGARRAELVALVSRGSLRWVAAGLVIGAGLALAASRAMSSVIYGVEPWDWRSLVASTVVFGLVGTLAALLPVWRATRIDPVITLRAE